MKREAPETPHPDALALRHRISKNRWLVRARWVYPFFIIAFFLAYRFLAHRSPIAARDALLVFLLPLAANLLFRAAIRRLEGAGEAAADPERWGALAARQLDVDLGVFALTVYFSGGLQSPVIALMMLIIVISTFLADARRALRHTVAAMALLLAIALLQEGSGFFSGPMVTDLLAHYFLFVIAYVVSGYLAENLRRNEELLQELLLQSRTLAVTDGLTGLFNQTHFFRLLDRETGRSQAEGLSYALILFDVDHFKNFNDRHGHLRGSETLRAVADVMRRKFRAGDLLAKYGGDEFVIILPKADKVGAYLAAERLREAVEKGPFPGAETQPLGKLTISIGLAAFPEHGSAPDEILNRADKALYFAKESGRNRTVIYSAEIEKEGE